jgi:hypothetical protein
MKTDAINFAPFAYFAVYSLNRKVRRERKERGRGGWILPPSLLFPSASLQSLNAHWWGAEQALGNSA